MHHSKLFRHGAHGHKNHHHKRGPKHGGKFGRHIEKIGKHGHHFKHMLRALEESDLSNINPQDANIQDQIRLFVINFFEKFCNFESGEDLCNQGAADAAESTCMWRGRGCRHYGWKGCQYYQSAGRNNSEETNEETAEEQGKKSEEETPYCHHYRHHRRYGRKHHGYGCGKCQGRFSGDESGSDDEKWSRQGRMDHHHHHHHGRYGNRHEKRMGLKKHNCCWFCVDATTTVNKNANSGSKEPNQEVSGNGMQTEPVTLPAVANLEHEEKSQEEANQEVQEVAENLRKSSLE